jgi:hypothetical protein
MEELFLPIELISLLTVTQCRVSAIRETLMEAQTYRPPATEENGARRGESPASWGHHPGPPNRRGERWRPLVCAPPLSKSPTRKEWEREAEEQNQDMSRAERQPVTYLQTEISELLG